MKSTEVSYQSINRSSNIVLDYVEKNIKLKPFINHFPTLENFEKQIIEKQNHSIDRGVLTEVLQNQNSTISLSDKSQKNIQLLQHKTTFTVTTGHQLCMFTGPLYFIYKIISTINLAEQLQVKYSANNFVPVFWMATEDHDFEEINHINLFGKRIVWNSKQDGPVGRMNLDDFSIVINELKLFLGDSISAVELISLFEKAYIKDSSLAAATRYLVNELFKEYGLVILDGDDKKLKEKIIPIIKKDILEQDFEKLIRKTGKNLASHYQEQAYVRPINFFKLSDSRRELIKGGITEKEINESPENFSPNVLLRPLYQETVLPNIAYVGGGSELAYWMQLKTTFQQENIPFPILVLRNSAMLLNSNQDTIRKNLGFSVTDLFLDEHQLQKKFILSELETTISLEEEGLKMKSVYVSIINKINDVGLQNSVNAQLQKQQKSFKKIEEKLLRLEKQKKEDSLRQIRKLKTNLFPNKGMQERHDNFILFYLKMGDDFIKIIKENLNPLNPNFVILTP